MEEYTACRSPFDEEYPFYMLIEQSSSQGKLSEFSENPLFDRVAEFMEDGIIAQDTKQYTDIWNLRE